MDWGDPLVTLEHADGTAAVFRDTDGSTWLTGYIEGGGATGIDEPRGAFEGLTGDRTVQGGLLPARAVRVEVVDPDGERFDAAVGDGAWLAVLGHDLFDAAPVRFLDHEGRSVRPPLPAEWPREPVPDAPEPCPACESVAWELVRPLDDSRGMVGLAGAPMRPSPIVVCGECGHEEACGGLVVMSLPGVDGAAADERPADRDDERRRERERVLRRVAFPALVLEGWDAQRTLVGWGVIDNVVSSISVSHSDIRDPTRSVVVDLAAGDGWRESISASARESLAGVLDNDWPAERSDGAVTVWLAHCERDARRSAAAAETTETTITIDGVEHPAVLARDGERRAWAAATQFGYVTIAARGIADEHLRLVTLEDPAEQLEQRG